MPDGVAGLIDSTVGKIVVGKLQAVGKVDCAVAVSATIINKDVKMFFIFLFCHHLLTVKFVFVIHQQECITVILLK